MKQKLKKGKVKGSVLFTTTGVMLVLVVFLMSTMVLASSANRRSYYTYYETQAQYAAQSALDAITNSAYSDTQFHDWIVGNAVGTGTRLPITVNFSNSEIQFNNDEDTVVCFVEPAESNFVWDDVTQAVHEQKAWKITATATVGNGRNATDYSVCNYIYENFHVEDPNLLNTVQNNGINTVYTYAQSAAPPPGPTPSGGTPIPSILSLSPSATNNNFVSLGPQYAGMSGFPVGRTLYGNAPADYTVATRNENHAVGNIIYINNLFSETLRNVTFQKFGESAIYYGDIYNKNAGDIAGFRWRADIDPDEVAAYGNDIPYNKLPYVYVDGTMYCSDAPYTDSCGGGGFYVGYGTNITPGNYPVNLYCGAVHSKNANDDFAVYGDAYLYDPALDSVICSGRLENGSALKTFVGNNVQKANNQFNPQTVGGNLYCNNHSLELGHDKKMTIDGDLIFTNRQGTLNITNDVHVKGKVLCDGQIQGRNRLTADGGIYEGTTECAPFYDGTYNTQATTGYVDRADATPLLPYPFRLDEIHTRYYRWDLKAGSRGDADSRVAGDALIAESSAAGHSWGVEELSVTEGSTTYTYYVPYTDPTFGCNFIPKYNPTSPATALSQIGLNYETVSTFDTLLGTSAPTYDDSNLPQNITSLPIIWHDANGTEQTSSIDAYVIKENCTINLNSDAWRNGSKKIFIDPKAGNHTDSTTPLIIKLTGGTVMNCYEDIIINNTAAYNPSYSTCVSYASESTATYAGRREVFIFIEDGLRTMAGPFRMYTTGAYDQVMNRSFRVVSNPYYPGMAGFDNLDPSIKYAYELVPNYCIFGEAFGNYNFDNGCFINGDILMPNATIHNGNPELFRGAVDYREEPNSNVYHAANRPMVGAGSAFVNSYDTGTNIAQTVYIGDTHRGNPGNPPTITDSSTDYEGNGNALGQQVNDQFSNHHRGGN